MPNRRERLDCLLVERGLASSRDRAQRLILGGEVRIGDRVVDKPGTLVPRDADVRLTGADIPYASRGGLKLEGALKHWSIDVRGRSALDVGASTGGFTDCLLQRGAARVIAVDVGYGQLAWGLRNDPRVVVMERTNIRHLEAGRLPFVPDFAVADVSFISLRLVLPKIGELVQAGSPVIVLVKPQFEVGKGEVGKGGVVRDESKMSAAVEGIAASAEETGFIVRGWVESVLRGPKGNREFFLYLTSSGPR